MLDTLTATQLARICDGTWHNQPSHGFSGVQIDSRQMQSGDLFFALPGDHVDGHKFVSQLETAKHQAAIVSKFMPEAAAAQLVVSDPLHALQALARYIASETDATKIAITGSVGKTGTKDILAYCLSPLRKTHATKGNFNNDIGAPLTITRMPSDADCLICELGMNHAGEISLLSTMMKPDISIITKIAESHAGHFADITDIAKAKAEIFDGMTAGGIAILPADDEQLPLLMSAAKTAGITNILTFGTSQDADLRLLDQSPADDGQHIMADLCGTKVEISIGMAAPHWALSALACLGVAHCLELPLSDVADSLATMQDLAGRGAKFQAIIDTHALTVIDDAYNAGPASMLAALEGLSHIQNRKAAILSDMLELGDLAPSAHLRLAKSIEDAGITEILLIGPMMAELRSKLPSHIRVICIHDAGDAKAAAKDIAANTDTLLIKGSHGSGAHILAAYLRDFAPNMAPDAAPAGGQNVT